MRWSPGADRRGASHFSMRSSNAVTLSARPGIAGEHTGATRGGWADAGLAERECRLAHSPRAAQRGGVGRGAAVRGAVRPERAEVTEPTGPRTEVVTGAGPLDRGPH